MNKCLRMLLRIRWTDRASNEENRVGVKLERGDENGLIIHSESRRYWTGNLRTRDQVEGQEAVGEESERKIWKYLEKHGQTETKELAPNREGGEKFVSGL